MVSAGRSRPEAEVLPAHVRSKATDDVEHAVGYYTFEADAEEEVEVATRFIDGLERAVRQLELHPEVGSLRFAFELDLPGLRSFRVDAFPYVIMYLVRGQHLDVLRVLPASRDVPTTLRDS